MNEVHSKSTPLISLRNVGLTINNKNLVSDINLTIRNNDNVCLIGPNGAGKSTLVKLILGLMKPSTGQITKDENLIVGYVPQSFSVPNILPLRVIDLLKQASKNRLTKVEINTLYKQLFLTSLLKRQLSTLSGGETQRVLLARALLEKPNLLILDEPMQGLDPESERLLYQFIDALPDFLHCSLFVVSHDLHWVMRGSRHVVCLNKHICCEGKPLEIKELDEFQQLFSHHNGQLSSKYQYEQPYIHNHDHCQHITEEGSTDNNHYEPDKTSTHSINNQTQYNNKQEVD